MAIDRQQPVDRAFEIFLKRGMRPGRREFARWSAAQEVNSARLREYQDPANSNTNQASIEAARSSRLFAMGVHPENLQTDISEN